MPTEYFEAKPQRVVSFDEAVAVVAPDNAPAELIEVADTVTEMTMVKHHYRSGVPAQRGIED